MSPLLIWTGFFFALAVLLIVSRKNFAGAMFLGAFVLAVFTIPFNEIAPPFISAFTDPSTILLAIAVGLIPIIGGTLKDTGQMDNLVRNMRIGKKAFLAVSPALLGMLPMPGGALLSAPMVEKAGKGVTKEKKCGLNVWFRHILFLIYPLTPALIVSVKIAHLDLYHVLLYLAPFFLFSTFLGYFFFLHKIRGEIDYEKKPSLRKLLPPLTVILVAPILDFLIKTFFAPSIPEAATLIAITSSLIIAVVIIGRSGVREFGRIAWKSKPWDFAFIIVGMAVFLNVFQISGIPTLIESLQITPVLLCVVIGFLLGFATGRIQTPALIIIPIFLTKGWILSAPVFAVMFFSIFLGYVLSPIHPCVSLSAQFFLVEIKDFLKVILPPTLIGFVVSFILLSIIP
jgi:integral membrane protein (TIGR00529 family)